MRLDAEFLIGIRDQFSEDFTDCEHQDYYHSISFEGDGEGRFEYRNLSGITEHVFPAENITGARLVSAYANGPFYYRWDDSWVDNRLPCNGFVVINQAALYGGTELTQYIFASLEPSADIKIRSLYGGDTI